MNLHRGQGLDLLWRDSLQCPTEDEYIAMVNNSALRSYVCCRILIPVKRNRWAFPHSNQINDGMCIHTYRSVSHSRCSSSYRISDQYRLSQWLCSPCQPHWNIFPNSGRLYEFDEHRCTFLGSKAPSLCSQKAPSTLRIRASQKIWPKESFHSLLCTPSLQTRPTDKSWVRLRQLQMPNTLY